MLQFASNEGTQCFMSHHSRSSPSSVKEGLTLSNIKMLTSSQETQLSALIIRIKHLTIKKCLLSTFQQKGFLRRGNSILFSKAKSIKFWFMQRLSGYREIWTMVFWPECICQLLKILLAGLGDGKRQCYVTLKGSDR